MQRNWLIALSLSLCFTLSSAGAETSTDAQPFAMSKIAGSAKSEAEQPTFISMAADAVVARPLLLATTIVGAGLFVVTLPFTLLSKSASKTADTLIAVPAHATFTRCLGCSFEQ